MCTNGACACDTAWGGANCSTLKLLSPAGFTPSGFHSLNSSWSAWGGGAVFDPTVSKWQGVFHEISGRCGMRTWGANGQTRLAQADRPAGPYTVTKLLLPPSACNPSIGRDPATGTFLITHLGVGNASGGKCVACPEQDGITHSSPTQTADCGNNPPGSHEIPLAAPATGPLSATDFTAGPWTDESKMPNAPNGASTPRQQIPRIWDSWDMHTFPDVQRQESDSSDMHASGGSCSVCVYRLYAARFDCIQSAFVCALRRPPLGLKNY